MAVGRDRARRHDVVEKAAMLVVHHDQEGAIEQVGIGAQGVVDLGDQHVAAQHVVRRVLVVLIGAEIGRLDEGIGRQIAAGDVVVPVGEAAIAVQMLELMGQHQGLRHVAEIDPPRHPGVVQLVVERALVVEVQLAAEQAARLADMAQRSAGMGEQPVDPGRARQ